LAGGLDVLLNNFKMQQKIRLRTFQKSEHMIDDFGFIDLVLFVFIVACVVGDFSKDGKKS
jgi:hypothetical protein